MEKLKPIELLKHIAHRNIPLPNEDWVIYSEWKNVLQMHWKIDASEIKHIIPQNLSIDTFEGGAWITLCISSVDNYKNKLLNIINQGFKFNQVLMQTYIINNGRPGIFIFNQELEKSFTKNLYQKLFKLKLGQTDFQLNFEETSAKYFASNINSGFKLGLHIKYGAAISNSILENWLGNRFKYFFEKGNHVQEHAVHHLPLQFKDVSIEKFKINFNFGGLSIDNQPDYIHYSPGIQKLFWPQIQIKK